MVNIDLSSIQRFIICNEPKLSISQIKRKFKLTKTEAEQVYKEWRREYMKSNEW